jgi:hypothetical protein
MAEMKVLVVLPLVLACASCIYPEPYPDQRSPYYRPDGARRSPYDRQPGAGPGSEPGYGDDYGAESGRYRQLPDDGTGPRQPDTRRAPSPRIDDDFEPAPAPAPQPKPKPEYPVAEATENPGRVISPYAPYNVIDVEGFKSGALAKDPSNGKIFRVP